MNRLIEFRVRNLDRNEWAEYGTLDMNGKFNQEGVEYHDYHYEVNLFTGLYDKNKKKIFEGDVIHLSKDAHTNPPFVWDNINREVTFENGMFMVGGRTLYQSKSLYLEDFSVIGNVYESPELLKSL